MVQAARLAGAGGRKQAVGRCHGAALLPCADTVDASFVPHFQKGGGAAWQAPAGSWESLPHSAPAHLPLLRF